MTKEDNAVLTAEQNGHQVRINVDQLGDFDFSPWRFNNDVKKYNIRLRKQDIHLLNALSDPPTKPRSDLINHLIHRVLYKQLMSIPDIDARALVAEHVDDLTGYDPEGNRWLVDVLDRQISEMLYYLNKYNEIRDTQDPEPHSESYKKLKAWLEKGKE